MPKLNFNLPLTCTVATILFTLRFGICIIQIDMKKILFLLLSGFLFCSVSAQKVKWYTIEEAVELNKKEPRKIMIDVFTDWCGWCKVMDKNTFQNDTIAEYLNQEYYPVKFNAEQKDSIVFQGHSYKFVAQGSRGYNELAAALLGGQMSYPSVVFLDENLQGLHIEKGYVEAKRFDMILKYIGGNFYKNTAWDTWSVGYQSPIVQ
jgi:thioredoxin-related protein